MLDASAGLYLASSARGFAGMARHELHAPSLFWSEAISAVHQRYWRRVISSDLAASTRRAVLDAPVTGHTEKELYERAWEIAERAGWAKTYDAEYVALADLLSVPLVTRDDRLSRGARRFVDVLGPTDLEAPVETD